MDYAFLGITFDLVFFLTAIVLLWTPLPYVARKDLAYNGRARVTPSTISGLWRAWQNWVDLVRSVGGTYLLLNLSMQFEAASAGAAQSTLVKEGILVIGVLMQTVRFGSGQGFLAPLFYLTGVTVLLPGHVVGGFAVALAWIFACGLRDPRFLLPVMAGALLVSGYFLSGLSRSLLGNLFLVTLPLIMVLFLQRRLGFVSRERTMTDLPKAPVPPRRPLREQPPRTAKVGLKPRPSTAQQ